MNPFKPTFGSIPASIAGRNDLIDDIIGGLENAPGDPNRASILVGPRGSGKTVLLASMAEKAEEMGWISVNVTASGGMLEEIVVQVRDKASHILDNESRARLSGLQFGGIGITIEKGNERTTWRSIMTEIVSELNTKDVGLLITVDEVTHQEPEVKELVNVFQHFVRERRNVAILMAGLPNNVSMLLRDDKVSFLRRAFQHNLGSIEQNDVAYAIKDTVEDAGRTIDHEALEMAARSTNGFAFMIQLVGYHAWRQSQDDNISTSDVSSGIDYAARDMERMIFDITLSELTDREMEFLYAMSEDSSSSHMSDIAARMGIDQNNATKIRKRLIEMGIIAGTGRGRVAFDIPMLREYIASRSQ